MALAVLMVPGAMAAVASVSGCLAQEANARPDGAAAATSVPGTAIGPPDDPAGTTVDRKRQTEGELEALAREIRTTEEREAQIRLEIEGLDRDRVRISEQLVATAARIRGLETELTTSELRIGTIESEAAGIRRSLSGRRAVMADVLAALQRIGRKPPPALLVRPEDALASIRSAILVGALLPELRHEAEVLVGDLDRLARLKERSAAERDRFKADLVSLADERTRLEALFDERRRSKGDQQRKLDEERRRAGDLAAKATSTRDLIARLESEIESARKAAEAARKADDAARSERRPDQKTVTAALRDPGRMQPAQPFGDTRGHLPLPGSGAQIKGFGEDDGLGGTLKGIQIAARAAGRVTSPCDGWILYAGTFRSYGKLLIINGGGGYHVLLAGLDRIDVEAGQFVLSGEPVGTMGVRRVASVAGTGGSGTTDSATASPLLYVEFRKDNAPIDPTPWWVQSRDEKVRG